MYGSYVTPYKSIAQNKIIAPPMNIDIIRIPKRIEIIFERKTGGIIWNTIVYIKVIYSQINRITGKKMRDIVETGQSWLFKKHIGVSHNRRKDSISINLRRGEYIKEIQQFCTKNKFIPGLIIKTNKRRKRLGFRSFMRKKPCRVIKLGRNVYL